jgi:purine-binding chemotaxis protein CheW
MGEGKKDSGLGPRTALDWETVRRRQEAFQHAVEQGFVPTGDDRRRILRERAGQLAREPERKDEDARMIEVIEFDLAYERYAFESTFVREIHPLRNFTPLPCTPSFVLGIMNVRGQIISIVDLKRFFDLPEKGLADLNRVIILQGENIEFGVLGDSIIGATSLNENDLQSSLPTLTGIREKYLKGLTREGTVILEAAAILSDSNIIVNEHVKI